MAVLNKDSAEQGEQIGRFIAFGKLFKARVTNYYALIVHIFRQFL